MAQGCYGGTKGTYIFLEVKLCLFCLECILAGLLSLDNTCLGELGILMDPLVVVTHTTQHAKNVFYIVIFFLFLVINWLYTDR